MMQETCTAVAKDQCAIAMAADGAGPRAWAQCSTERHPGGIECRKVAAELLMVGVAREHLHASTRAPHSHELVDQLGAKGRRIQQGGVQIDVRLGLGQGGHQALMPGGSFAEQLDAIAAQQGFPKAAHQLVSVCRDGRHG